MNSKVHIAIVIPGGIGTGRNNVGIPVLEKIVERLSKTFRITVFSLFPVNTDYTTSGFSIEVVNGANTLFKAVNFFLLFRSIHKRDPFSAVHGFWALPTGWMAVTAGKMFRVKSIVSVLGGDAAALPGIDYGQLRRTRTASQVLWTLRNADIVTVLTAYLQNNLLRAGLSRQMEILPWGVDTLQFNFNEKSLSAPLQLLHIASLAPVKDQKTLLKAVQIIHRSIPCKLRIIGEGELEKSLRRLVKELDLTDVVTFLGLLPNDQLPSYHQNSDILLHTSLSEGQSETVTEAMSAGTVVCGTKVGLMHDLPECCVAVDVGDHEGLAAAVINLCSDQQRMNQLRRNARRWAEENSIDWTVGKISALYKP